MIDHCHGERSRSKRRKVDESNLRKQCRVSCGADIVIQHTLPYLLPTLLPGLELTDTGDSDDDRTNNSSDSGSESEEEEEDHMNE